MPFSVYAPSPREREFAVGLRGLCIEEIQKRDADTVCKLLGFERPALEELLWETRWDLRVAFRVADGLGLSVVDRLGELVRENQRSLRAV